MTDEEMLAEQKRIEDEFERAYDAHALFGPVNNDEFLKLAVQIFCAAAFQDEALTGIGQKAARALAMRLSGLPDDTKNWRVTFPPLGLEKKQMMTEKRKKSRAIAFKICELVRRGTPATHAMTQVAAKLHISYDKAKKDYYEHKDLFVALLKTRSPDDEGLGNFNE